MPLNVRTEQVGFKESLERDINKFNASGGAKIRASIRERDFTQPLGRITQKADEFTKSLEASNARVIAFGASAAIIGGVTRGFSELVVQAIKVEKILTDINVVLGTTSQNLSKFGDNLFKVARNTAQTLEVAAEAALEFSRQGLSMEETLRRTNDALILTRLTGLQAADSVKGLTAAVNGFADAGLTTTQIINKLAAVDVKFAVGADDLINALARAGAVAQDAGVNFDQLVGAVTSAQQITARGGAVIGNSFKTIFTRIQRSSTLDALEDLGIAVRDIRGNTLPALRVLKNLSDSYETLGSSTRAAVAEQVGGVFQINVLKAALKDLNRENSLYAQATKISNQATNQAQLKNEQLQKTISALATQANLSIQELAANIGDLTLAPGIAKILESFNDFTDFLNNTFGKNAEGIGAEIGKSLMRGIGNVITGPGVVLTVGIFAKLFANALKFARSSIKDILGIVTQKEKERKIQESIVEAMQRNRDLSLELNNAAGNKAKQEEIILSRIKEQTALMNEQKAIAASVAPGLLRSGVRTDLSMKSKNASGGFIPNYASQNWQAGSSGGVTPYERLKEQGMAIKSGYAPGPVKKMNIAGIGDVVYNGNESVEMIPGLSQPAIMPPRGSRAANIYGSAFKSRHGFNPYSRGSTNNSTYSDGFVPNFARAFQSGTMLNLPSARMVIQHPEDRGWKRLDSPLANVMHNTRRLDFMFDILKDLGITALSRKFYFANQDPRGGTSGAKKVAKNRKHRFSNKVYGGLYEQGIYTNKLGNMKEKGFLRTDTTNYTIKGKKAIAKKGFGDEQAVVDFVRQGRLPMEAKLDWNPGNLLGKSIFQASDRSIENFLDSKGVSASSIQNIRNVKEQRALSSMQSMKGFRNASIEDAINMGFASGFIPSFADPRSRQQKIRDVLADPANKNVRFKGGAMTTKTFNTRARGGMFHSMYVESYINTGNKSDLDYLVSVGYNKQELMALRRHKQNGGKVRVHGDGFVPNFASPLMDAIDRERSAGVPKSMMRIERDPSLVGPSNPFGLGVTNKRDEPNGIKQGIRRSKRMGIDPRFHGSMNNATYARGIIPNYADAPTEADLQRGYRFRVKEGPAPKKGMGMESLFALTSAAYAVEGMFSQLEGTLGKTVSGFTALAQGLTQGLLLKETFKQMSESGSGFLSKIGKFGPLFGVVGAAVPVFQALKENTELLDTPMDTLRKSAERTSKAVDALGNAMSSATEIESTKKELAAINNSADSQSYDNQMKSLQLRIKLNKEQVNLSNQTTELSKHLNLSSKEIQLMTSGTAQGMKKLQEAQLQYQQSLNATTLAQNIMANAGGRGLMSMLWGGDEDTPQKANQREIALMQAAGALTSGKSPDRTSATKKALEEFSKVSIVNNAGSFGDINTFNPSVYKENRSGLDAIIKKVTDSGDLQLASLLSGISAGSPEQAQKHAKRILEIMEGIADDEEEKAKEVKVDLQYAQQTKIMRQKTNYALERQSYLLDASLKLESQQFNLKQKEASFNNKLLDAIGATTKAKQVEAEIALRRADELRQFEEREKAINNEYLQSQKKEIAKQLFGSDKFRSFENLTRDVVIGGPTGAKLGFTLTGDEAFDRNLEKVRNSSTLLAEALKGNVQDIKRARQLMYDYLVNLNNIDAQTEAINALVKAGMIQQKDVVAIQEHLRKTYENKLTNNVEDFKIIEKRLETEAKELNLSKGTLSSKQKILAAMLVDKDFAKKRLNVIKEDYLIQAKDLTIARLRLKVDLDYLKTAEGIQVASENEYQSRLNALDESKKSLMIDTAIVQNKERLNTLIAEQVAQEEKKAINQRTQDAATFETKKRTGFFRREGARGVASGRETLGAELEKLRGQRAVYMSEGNSGRGSEVELEIAQKQKELNFELNQGSLFADSLAVKIAEANVEMERFGETLAETTFDAVKGGFQGLLQDMGDSSKSVGDSILGFFGGIAGKIHQALVERASAQITSGIFEMTGLSQGGMYNGGMVSRYSSGGSTRSVPAMLTSGEFVVRKKIVDRLGKSSLDKLNQSGSLEDLYNKPNEDNFEVFNSGGIIAPPIIRLKEGGSLDNYLAKRNRGDDRTSQNERAIVDGELVNSFTNTLMKFMGGIVKMNLGGLLKQGLSSSSKDSAAMKIIKGGGYLAGSALAAYQGRGSSGAQGPTAPISPQALNTRSSLSIDPTSGMMSARYRAQDQYSSDYGKYLIDRYNFNIERKNEKVRQRAGLIQSIGGAAAIAGGMYLGNKMFASQSPNTVTQSQMNIQNRISRSQDSFYSQLNNSSSRSSSNVGSYNQSIATQNFLDNYKYGFGGNYYHGGFVNSPYSYFNRGGSVGGAYSNSSSIVSSSSNAHSIYLNKGGHVYSSVNAPTVNRMSNGGKVFGPNGVDKVGPVMLDRGEYVIKASSVNKVEKQYPGFFDQLNSMKMNEGGIVDPSSTTTNTTENNSSSSSSSNVTININVSSGETSVQGGEAAQQAMASRIKDAVVGVIAQEKRVGGMLRGN